MKQSSLIIEKATKQMVKRIAEQEVYGWPPLCMALYYQPIRPSKERKVKQTYKPESDTVT